jgi:hypothetical protein
VHLHLREVAPEVLLHEDVRFVVESTPGACDARHGFAAWAGVRARPNIAGRQAARDVVRDVLRFAL